MEFFLSCRSSSLVMMMLKIRPDGSHPVFRRPLIRLLSKHARGEIGRAFGHYIRVSRRRYNLPILARRKFLSQTAKGRQFVNHLMVVPTTMTMIAVTWYNEATGRNNWYGRTDFLKRLGYRQYRTVQLRWIVLLMDLFFEFFFVWLCKRVWLCDAFWS